MEHLPTGYKEPPHSDKITPFLSISYSSKGNSIIYSFIYLNVYLPLFTSLRNLFNMKINCNIWNGPCRKAVKVWEDQIHSFLKTVRLAPGKSNKLYSDVVVANCTLTRTRRMTRRVIRIVHCCFAILIHVIKFKVQVAQIKWKIVVLQRGLFINWTNKLTYINVRFLNINIK